jgi:hypothetical protein
MLSLTPQEVKALLIMNSFFAVGVILFVGALLYEWYFQRSPSA